MSLEYRNDSKRRRFGAFVCLLAMEALNERGKSEKEEECTFEGDSREFEAGILNGIGGVSSMIPLLSSRFQFPRLYRSVVLRRGR